MRQIYILFLLLSLSLTGGTVHAEPVDECVVVLHGLGRTERSMGKIETSLLKAGYRVLNQGYESTKYPIPVLARDAVGAGLRFCEQLESTVVHFVTHSLGAILVRYYLQDKQIDSLGRVVMLAPPNQGSEVADAMSKFDWFEALLGPAGPALVTDEQGIPAQLNPIPGEIGVIAGNATSDPWFSPMIPGRDDGKVSVLRTRLAEMSDFLVVEEGHTFIMRQSDVIAQVLFFLQHGRFDHQPPSRDSSIYLDR